MVFGANRASRSARNVGGTANPYASVKFGNTTQRTSEVYDSLDPIWPRQETMFMDVAMPASELTHPAFVESSPASVSSELQSSSSGLPQLSYKTPNTVLTVALFHTPEVGRVHKYPSKGAGSFSGDSDDQFLGMASVDLMELFTGRRHTFDEWLPLSGTEYSQGRIRIVCEYEASDPPPRPGDYVRFTSFCHPADLYPVEPGRKYQVAELDGDDVIISYKTPEGWICSFQAHRFMLICDERHHNALEYCQDELASLSERLTHSPMLHSVVETVERVAVDGLLSVGSDVVHGGLSLLGRWFEGGLETAINDVVHATNLDGRHNPNALDTLGLPNTDSTDTTSDQGEAKKMPASAASPWTRTESTEALPNMPACPITGEPMIDPVVAADGKYRIQKTKD